MKNLIIVIILSLLSSSVFAQWELVMQEGGNIYSQVERNNIMYAGTQFGIFKSDDGGVNWTESNNGLSNTVVHPILVNGTRLFAGTGAGVFISDDEGDNWFESNQGLTISKINSFVKTDDGIYAGTDDQGIFYSSDNGANWIAKNSGLSNLSVKTMIIHNNRLFAGTYGAGIFYSDNFGESWTQSNNGLFSWFISYLTSKNDKLFIGTNSDFNISEDNGQNWNSLNTPFTHKVLCSVNYNDHMFVGTDGDGVAYTTDYGQSWTLWNEGLVNKNMYCIEVFDTHIWAASCCGYGLYKRLLPNVTLVEDHSLEHRFKIIPNPATDIVTIKTNCNNAQIQIMNQQGQLIFHSTIQFSEQRLDISKFQAGLYVLIFEADNKVFTTKLIIK